MSSNCHNLLLTSLTTYYKNNPNIRFNLKQIIQGESLLSLRVIDWFVTHYARVNQVIYWIDISKNVYYEKYPDNGKPNPNIRKFHLYMEYRAQLQSYTKLFFDPFRRHERITFILENTPLDSIETTVGQLNFFRWVFQNHIVSYVLANLQQIENAMATYQKQIKKNQKSVSLTDTVVESAIPIKGGIVATNNTAKKQAEVPKKKNTHIGNIVTRAPCFIRFD